MKLPQISTIFYSKSSKGVNLSTFWLEIGVYLIGVSYRYGHDFHYTTYLDTGLLVLQSSTIVFLVIYYGSKWTIANGLYAIFATSYAVLAVFKLIPYSVLGVSLFAAVPITIMSKVAQIRTIYQIKSRGKVSILMWSLAAYGCYARLFTFYVEVGDFKMLANYFVSAVLNTAVVAMCLYYGDGERLQTKKD